MFFERFEAIVRNTTHHTMLTVKSPVRVAETEVLDPSGQWQRMLTLSSFETANTQDPPCIKVKPRREFTFPNVIGQIVLPRGPSASHTTTVRFFFSTTCTEGSLTRTTTFVTEPIQITLKSGVATVP